MTSITVNLTLEQVLEFVQNLPLEYKKAVKEKLESEKVEEINENELDYISENSDSKFSPLPIQNLIEPIEQPKKSKVDQIAGLVDDPNAPDSKTLINQAIIQRYKERS